jgi:nitrous oxidase accessory protein NosD
MSRSGSSERATKAARLARVAAAGGLLAAMLLGGPAPASAAGADPASDPVPGSTVVPAPPAVTEAAGNGEAAIAAAEDRRLVEVRAAIGAARAKGAEWKSPYNLGTGTGYTLVLTPRSSPYTIADMLQLLPTTFLRENDGSYLLLQNIYVSLGASLDMSGPGGMVLRMASNANGFVSIVSFGGNLQFTGSAGQPATITSWDPRTDQPDLDVADGRAYIRSIGGTFTLSYANVQDLGFWSGRTGGIGLTGTDRPTTGSTTGPSVYTGPHGKTARKSATPTPAPTGAAQPDGNLGDSGVTSQPAGPLANPDTQFSVPGLSYVGVRVDHSTITGDAFGLFISGATGIVISNVNVTGSLVDGIVLHRYASQGVLTAVDSSNNSGDGIDISRAADQIQITGSTASFNTGNGFTINGQPIAQGPSASGEPMGAYGNNSVSSSTAEGNGHYGIEVLGGLNTAVDDNTVIGNQMGIVVRRGAQSVTIVGNQLREQDREGISIRDGNQAVTVSGNLIQGAATGIYVRASVVQVIGNIVTGAQIHGVTLVGADKGTLVNNNTLTGAGPGAISSYRATGPMNLTGNQTADWFNTTSMWIRIKALISPLTIIWAGVFALIAVTALRGRRTRTGRSKRHEVRRAKVALGSHPYRLQEALAVPPDITALELPVHKNLDKELVTS